MEKAHRRVGQSYLGGHYSSYKQPLCEARRAFCCGNWLNGRPKQTIPLEIYVYLRSLPISSMRATWEYSRREYAEHCTVNAHIKSNCVSNDIDRPYHRCGQTSAS